MKTIVIEWRHPTSGSRSRLTCAPSGKPIPEFIASITERCVQHGLTIEFRETLLAWPRRSSQLLLGGSPIENLIPHVRRIIKHQEDIYTDRTYNSWPEGAYENWAPDATWQQRELSQPGYRYEEIKEQGIWEALSLIMHLPLSANKPG